MKAVNGVIAVALMAAGILVMVAVVGARTSTPTPRVSASPSPHGLLEGEQRPALPDCVGEDGHPTDACVWDRWVRGSSPNPGVTPRYVIVTPAPDRRD